MSAAPRSGASPLAIAPSCHDCAGASPAPAGSPVIALVGAPNSGKSTLFNALTGAKAQMGNWPGTTVEVSRGAWKAGDVTYDVIDFPGAYSLDAMSPDEELTREMLINRESEERPDLVIVAVDATAPARGLYLFAEIAEHPYRMVVALTKTDVAAAQGVDVDAVAMQEALGVPVVDVDPRRRAGVEDVRVAVAGAMTGCARVIRAGAGEDVAAADEARFAFIDRVVAASTTDRGQKPTWSDRIDRVALNPFAGPLLFLGVMWLVFQITTTVAAPLQDGLEGLITGPISDWARSAMETIGLGGPIPTGLVVDGLIGGVGMVLTFAPLMALMFLCLAVLEDSGYMARAAVVTDRVMRAIGLPGKAFIPLIVGFGCNVPAISATRVLGNPRHRILTSLLIPFTSCSARLTVYVMLAAVFFPGSAGTVVFAMYVISIGLIVLTGLVLRHTLWRTMPSEPLVIDLPGYQLPMPRLALSVMWARLKGFLKTAGGIIVITVVAVWALMSVPVVPGHAFGSEELPPRDSAYGAVSEAVSPVFAPAGFGSWSLTGTLLTGFVAKEAVISTWAQTYAVEDVTDADTEEQRTSPLADNIRADFDRTSGGHGLAAVWAFMIFLLAYTPCVATVAAQKREIGLKWTLFGLATQLFGAWLLAVAVFQVLKVFL
ncbi:ferrous iron transport protein B [Corynebacterium freneyi]|uniref:ferrous iron transport protein B n=1 Tax=Corynebacterium freneyi TaxID=134034 RepID=UPI001EF1AA09|nr:ferrous iron transport protein B [Corynebacterium freneyi]MCG7440150.1 ferrous iron transport protein B [Corynebacterium freneyi]